MKFALILVSTVVMLVVGAISASAVSAAQEMAVEMTDSSLTVEAMSVTYDMMMKSRQKTAKSLGEKFELISDRSKAMALSDEEISKIAKKIADSAKVYLAELDDGTETYYIAVDFRNDNSMYLYNPFVLRQVTERLLERTDKLSKKRGIEYLMDYTHIVGEMRMHFIGYRITKNLGGENLKGLLGSLYQSCSVADLNIDEDRFPVMIRFFGVVVG